MNVARYLAYDEERRAGREAVADLFGGDFNAADDFLSKLYNVGWDLTPRATAHQGPYPFVLIRDEDMTGVSGTGVVAEGVEFTSKDGTEGVVALRWLSDFPTSVVFHDRGMASVEAVHLHGGKTRVVWR
jgi:hypothetical protein